MMWIHTLLFATSFLIDYGFAKPVQTPFEVDATKPRKLHGRFLHITDMHPDPHYLHKAAESTGCHRRKKNKKSKNKECDSPFRLTNYTLDFLNKNWADEIDFVIWTGDNARHDDDRKLPRTPAEIYDLNRHVAAKMTKVFYNKGIPVVPSLAPGPNSITNEYSSIWSQFIPFPYLQVFQRGAYYTTEVIPNEVAVISLNTMYFYDSNKVVNGCPYKDRNDPGNLQIDWLTVQLREYRERGHVPPAPGNYFPECYIRYVELALRFQDTILGHLFGHMNADHFFFLEAEDLRIYPDEDDETKVTSDQGLLESLYVDFATLPKKPKQSELDDYAVVNVAPSVVPNPYLPSFRIFSYNITDKGKRAERTGKRKHGHRRGSEGNKANCKSDEYRNTWRCHLDRTWHSDPHSPSRRNQRWTPLGYAQYYIPHLDQANKTMKPKFELEYVTYKAEDLVPSDEGGQVLVPLRHLPEELISNSATKAEKSKFAPYRLKDLTIGSWVRLGHEIGDSSRKKLRKKFRRYMFMV
ncbi:hypothetical protein CPB83DRAFT_866555 [Crepidotus variabilis]|uniref:Endopolyphosphatase n=1 Tax=Crepidotus variabilis TaxID=179855 RepID=A0A9P6JUI3_9AGAR|nr:hypothetical protein CPB83DRAFT_866555 [Crepidotus variabilis]